MLTIIGDIWEFINSHSLVIPTNIGYRLDGANVMGAGVAKQAAEKWPTFPALLGEYYKTNKERSQVIGFSVFMPAAFLIAFPVKPLKTPPNMSWQQPASLELIEKSTQELVALADTFTQYNPERGITLPRVGCGNGGLDYAIVRPILEKYLDDRFTLVTHPNDENQAIEYTLVEI